LKPIQADQIDGRSSAFLGLHQIQSQRIEAELDVLQHRKPRVRSERLKYDRDAFRGTRQWLVAINHRSGGGHDEPGGDPEQRRLARP